MPMKRTLHKHHLLDFIIVLVGPPGYDPGTSWSQTRRAADCAKGRMVIR